MHNVPLWTLSYGRWVCREERAQAEDLVDDGDDSLHGDGAPDRLHGDGAPSRPATVQGDDDDVRHVFGFGGRVIEKPFQDREDVGEIGILCANFGAERADARKRQYTRDNLKASPATIIGLQEAEDGVAQILEAKPPPPPLPRLLEAPAVAGQTERITEVSQRPQARYLVIMGEENGATCLTAVRASLASEINRLQWWWRMDGTFKKGGKRKIARSRVLITEIKWRRPVAQMHKTVHANVHFHHQTAKKAQGLVESHAVFFQELYQMCVRHGVSILAGDFNMSVFQVISILREMGLIIDLGAIYPWKKAGEAKAFSDSSGIFLIGGCTEIRLKCSLASFGLGNHGGGSGSGDADGSCVGPAHGQNDCSNGGGSIQDLEVFEKGQGYDLTAYLPKDREEFAKSVQEMFKVSTDIDRKLRESSDLLPRWKQKHVQREMFDPRDEFFPSGSHMPLLGFLGKNSNRSEAKLLERENTRREKLKDKYAQKGKGEGKGKGKGKGKAKSSSYQWSA